MTGRIHYKPPQEFDLTGDVSDLEIDEKLSYMIDLIEHAFKLEYLTCNL